MAACGRPAAKLGTVRIFNDKGHRFRAIKVLGPNGRPRWRKYANHIWELHHGPIPRGKRVLHQDGDSLNDDPGNLILGTTGDSLFLALEQDRVAEKRRRRVAKANALKNVEVAGLRRAFGILHTEWYLVIHPKRFILLRPHKSAAALMAGLGFTGDRQARRQVTEAGITPTLGTDLPREGYARVSEAEVYNALHEILPQFFEKRALAS
jgi:hypothetical protein